MWPRLGCALVVLPLLASCVSTASVGDRAVNPLSGILLGADDLAARSVEDGALPTLPRSAPAYTVVFPTAGDLERLAELHAGGPVEPEASPLSQSGEPSFTTGDGWFAMTPGQESDSYAADRLGWGWMQQAWFEVGQGSAPLIDCPPASGVDAVAQQFFAVLGLDVVLDGARRCTALATWLSFDLLLDGLPVVGVHVEATVDSAGTVVSASAPLLVVRPLAEVTLAPTNEIQRRFVAGPGFLSMYYPCRDCTWAVDSERPLGLALTTDGGLGPHDHIPGGVAPGEPGQFLVPALSVTATFTWRGNSQVVSRGVVAVSSAELVADPAEAGTARLADEHADPADATCVGGNEYDVGLEVVPLPVELWWRAS